MEVTTRAKNALAKKKILTSDDLARWLPRAYHDYREALDIEACAPGRHSAVRGVLVGVERKSGARGAYLRLKVSCGGGKRFSAFMFSRTYMFSFLSDLQGKDIVVTGKVQYDPAYGHSIAEPDGIVPAQQFSPRIATVYPKVGGVSDESLRKLVMEAAREATEPLEPQLVAEAGVCGYRDALLRLHAPKSPEDVRAGLARLRLNDLLYFAIKILHGRQRRLGENPLICAKRAKTDAFLRRLPFRLTGDQAKAIEAIACAMADRETPMDAVLQGDVGSGKTVVAAAAMALAAENGGQAALAAPRAVLAAQHFETLKRFFGEESVAFLSGSMSKRAREDAIARISDGRAKHIVGTHACLAESVPYRRLALAVTDEEHLFGAGQKDAVAELAKTGVHMLSMSATPIPRTISSILYAGRDVLTVREKPPGRIPVKTEVVSKRGDAVKRMAAEIASGHQCYVVCPSIAEDADSGLISVEAMEREYRAALAPMGVRVAIATGRMGKGEAEAAVALFADGGADILLSTTVIEVGVDIPNATAIVVEQADRFGLATLHQLRGRVGRGKAQSYCVLIAEGGANDRLRVMEATDDGFAIAEADAEIRGGGDLIGTEQHGFDRFVGLAARNPARFAYAMGMAERCVRDGLGKGLVALYEAAQPLSQAKASGKKGQLARQ